MKEIGAIVLCFVAAGLIGLVIERLGNIEKLLVEIRDSLRNGHG